MSFITTFLHKSKALFSISTFGGRITNLNEMQPIKACIPIFWIDAGKEISSKLKHLQYLQPIITQYFIDNKSEIWLLFLIAHSKRWRFNAFIDY